MNAEKSVEISALSIEEAILIGLTRMAVTREEVDITILDEGSRGFLGLGTRMARVRLTMKDILGEAVTVRTVIDTSDVVESVETPEELPAPTEAPYTPDESEASEIPAATQQSEMITETVDEPASSSQTQVAAIEKLDKDTSLYQSVEDAAQSIAEHLFYGLTIQLDSEWRTDEERPTLWISIRGTDANSLVGPRAQTLNSVQYLFRTLIHRAVTGSYDIVIDADGYRMRRRRSLENLAFKNAEKAIQSGQTVHLRSMPAHERRIIHMLLRENDRVETRSVGTGRDRAVTIIPVNASDK